MRKNALVQVEYESNILTNNPIGDPHKRTFPVYLPPDYKAKNTYPVLFNLSGWGGVGASILGEKAPFAKSITDLLDELIAKNPKYSCVVVFPDMSVQLGCSQYINSTATGNYMDYLCDELVPFIEKQFPVSTSFKLRGVFGHSSGGFGSMVTGMLRPEVFGHILSSAGDSHYIHLYPTLIPSFIKMVEKFGSVEKMVQNFLEKPNPLYDCPKEHGHSIMLLNICQCFIPNAKKPFGADLFFDIYTGELIDDVWKKFLAWDPVTMIDQYEDAIKKLQSFSLFAGAQDEYGIHLGHRQISKKLTQKKISHHFIEYEASHSGIYYKTIDHLKHIIDQMPINRA
ncbi:MAG: hypothetical protein KDD46_03955 [Bdellovibrionales bacterium]|nr:hypothetical protein [Bdellovibrionales bacterium]